MRRIVFITQAIDPASTVLGVTRDWVAALAERCGGVDVIALSAAPSGAAGGERWSNVRAVSLGKERGASKRAQLVAFYRALAVALPRSSAIFVHMVPRYALLAYPLALVAGRPLALWYAQGGVGASLQLAARLASWILTPTRDSFPLSGRRIDRRVIVTGHGIDTHRFAPNGSVPATNGAGSSAAREGPPRRLLAAGRLSPSKRYDLLLEALAALPDREWRLRIAGGPLSGSDRAYAARLRARATQLGLAGCVAFGGFVPYAEMAAEYRAAWALAHTSATGSLDKVVLEAMACGTPVVSSAPTSRAALGPLAEELWCPAERPDAVAARLAAALSWTPARRGELGAALRREVEQHHSLPRWADRVAGLLLAGRP